MDLKKTYFFILLIIFASCVKNNSTLTLNNSSTFDNLFQSFWNNMNINYAYWDIDSTNWDNVYKQYRPIFENLDITNDNDVRKSVQYFRKMTEALVDNHYIIRFSHNLIKDSIVYPALSRKL